MRYVPTILSVLAHPFVNGCIYTLLAIAAAVVGAWRAIMSLLNLSSARENRATSNFQGCEAPPSRTALPWWSPLSVLDTTAHSSMWEDFRSGRPSEVQMFPFDTGRIKLCAAFVRHACLRCRSFR